MKSGKDINRVSLARMRRVFIGTYSPNTRSESWIECGHFIQGVQIGCEEIMDLDGDGNIAERTNTFMVDGSAQPSQNDIGDFEFYNRYLAGKQNFAFWCNVAGDHTGLHDQLWFFKTYYQGNGKIIDNRISIFPKTGYESPRQAESVKFGKFIKGFEIVKVKNFDFKNGKLSYTAIERMPYGNLIPGATKITDAGK